MNKLLVIFFLALSLTGCTREQSVCPDTDYFVFGYAFGFCAGDCAHLYKIRNNKLYPDNVNNLYSDPVVFTNASLPDQSYLLAKNLPIEMPGYLRDHANTVIGCPDCHDQGMIYIECSQSGIVSKWHLDTDINALPAEVRHYVQKMTEVLHRLR